jgi:hypothetical protein
MRSRFRATTLGRTGGALGAAVLLTGLFTACPADPSAPDVRGTVVVEVLPGDTFRLAPGEAAALEGADLRVQFVGVTSDSRCPEDVTCVWEGDAGVVAHTIRTGEEHVWLLHTPGETIGPRSVDIGDGWVLELTGLLPAPQSNRPIAPVAYRAAFRVRRE